MTTMQWFGARYDAPMYEDMPEVTESQVGKKCMWCSEAILDGEPGITMPYVDLNGMTIEPVHIECHLRSVLGGPDHLAGNCYCVTGEHKESEMTLREESLTVIEWYWGKDWKERPCRT